MTETDVNTFVAKYAPSHQAYVQKLRRIIRSADKRIQERIKWNAPSYYYKEDIVTMGPARQDKMLLVFHHPLVVQIDSKILEGDYKDRRLVWLEDMKAILKAEKEIKRIVKWLVVQIDKKPKALPKTQASAKKGIKKICSKGHVFYKSSECPVCPKCEALKNVSAVFLSQLSAPARRALENQGIKSIKELSKYSEKQILALHGMGPGSLPKLRSALKSAGLKFKSVS